MRLLAAVEDGRGVATVADVAAQEVVEEVAVAETAVVTDLVTSSAEREAAAEEEASTLFALGLLGREAEVTEAAEAKDEAEDEAKDEEEAPANKASRSPSSNPSLRHPVSGRRKSWGGAAASFGGPTKASGALTVRLVHSLFDRSIVHGTKCL